MTQGPHGAGKTSIDLVDIQTIIELLNLKKGDHLLDLGCGRGNYSLAFAPRLAPDGKVIALDLWEEGIRLLSRDIESRGITNIEPKIADLIGPLPVGDDWADICFASTVFHDLARKDGYGKTLEEIGRVLKPGGVFALLEFQKVDNTPGPPRDVRIAPDELEEMLRPYGFEENRTQNLKSPLYYSEFSIK